ncbi:MAG: nucleotidyltransferase family protein [Thaumarchaeota archaeon]|nr:nucleotidyltransferase family protein [Nitrososphaerota archaeon]
MIEWLKTAGIRDIILSTGHLRRIIQNYFHDGNGHEVRITYNKLSNQNGFASQLKSLEKQIDTTLVCVSGDTLFNFDLAKTIHLHRKNKATATAVLTPYKSTLKHSFVEINEDGRLTDWKEKPEVKGLANIGCYIIEPSFLKHIPADKKTSIEKVFKDTMNTGERIFGHIIDGEFIDMSDKTAYKSAHQKYTSQLGELPEHPSSITT